jgi:hypothetical protein
MRAIHRIIAFDASATSLVQRPPFDSFPWAT